jgi:4a-hydroxytetrahydrobiopterin dehydratase
MSNLLKKKCAPCERKGIKPFTKEEAEDYLGQLSGWSLLEDHKKISKEYKFQDFIGAVNFINLIADIAEEEGHHPDIFLHDWNKVTVTLSTHSINGLTENDFIVAARIDEYRIK